MIRDDYELDGDPLESNRYEDAGPRRAMPRIQTERKDPHGYVPHRALARAVIAQAIRDVVACKDRVQPPAPKSPRRSAALQRERMRVTKWRRRVDALEFLGTESGSLGFWCEVAEVEASRVLARYAPRFAKLANAA